jgi:hypothetical protein
MFHITNTSLERFDFLERLAIPGQSPVFFKLQYMKIDPFPDKLGRRSRNKVALEDVSVKIEDRLRAGVFRMKMRRIMIIKEHPDDDSEEP